MRAAWEKTIIRDAPLVSPALGVGSAFGTIESEPIKEDTTMRIIHGFCAILAVVGLIGSAETAYGQAGATGRAASTAATVENAVQGNAIPGAANTTVPAGTTTATTLPAGTATAASPAQVPVSGRLNTTSPGSLLTGPGNLDQQGNEREAAAAGGRFRVRRPIPP